MQRHTSTKKPSSAYTCCREVDWRYNRRRSLRRDVEGNFFVYGNNEEVNKHLYQKKFLHKLKECPKCGHKINRQGCYVIYNTLIGTQQINTKLLLGTTQNVIDDLHGRTLQQIEQYVEDRQLDVPLGVGVGGYPDIECDGVTVAKRHLAKSSGPSIGASCAVGPLPVLSWSSCRPGKGPRTGPDTVEDVGR
eukprot:552097-Amphidinium_carterae.1